MFEINEDKTINITRGDIGAFTVDVLNEAGEKYLFQKGDVVRIKVTEKKACENVMFQKDFVVEEETEQVEILLTEEETKIGEVISKPTDYWYEVELNPLTNPQTIIGYDEDGAKILRLYPEGNDIEPVEPTPEDIPVVDEELDITSERPVQNQAITRAMLNLQEEIERVENTKNISSEDLEPLAVGIEENKGNIAKNKGSIEDLTDNVENLSNTLDTHTADKNNPHDVTANQVSIDGYSANNVQGEIDEISRTLGYRVGKNYIRYPYDDMRVNITSYGVTYGVDSDGVVTLNGTSKEIGGFVLNNARTNPVKLKKGTYKLTGCGNGATETTFYLFVYTIDENSNGVILAKDFGEGAEFTLENDTLIGVQINTTAIDVVFNNVVFKPMISKEGGDFEPPIADVQTQINNLQVLTLKSGAELLINGRMGILILTGAVFSNFTGTEILIEDSKYKPIRNTTSSVRAIVGGGYYADMMMSIKTDGTITLSYVQSQGATETKVPSTSTAVYGSIPYFING